MWRPARRPRVGLEVNAVQRATGIPAPWQAAVGPAWVEVDLDAIAENVRATIALLPAACRLLGVVKANGYGHGALEVGRTALQAGAAGLGVSTVVEGLALRDGGILAPVLVFTPPWSADLDAALEAGLTVTVVSLEHARAVAAAAARRAGSAVAHIKCDTGMGRYGFDPQALAAAAAALADMDGILWEGVFTHFARGADARSARVQLHRFLAAIGAAESGGLRFSIRHAAASGATIALPEARLDMVRVGNLLYGERPAAGGSPVLRRAFALRVQPAQIKDLVAGATVGYGSEWRARRPTRIAVLPIGYADGLDLVPAGPYRRPRTLVRALVRALLGALGLHRRLGAAIGDIEMGGRPVPVLGRVGMQQVTVDCSAIAPEVARLPATIHLRPTTAGAHLARVYLRDGAVVGASTTLGSLRPEAPASPAEA